MITYSAFLVFLLCPFAFFAGLINPRWVLLGEERTRLKSSAIYLSLFVVAFVTFGITAPTKQTQTTETRLSDRTAPQEPASLLTPSTPSSTSTVDTNKFNFPQNSCGDKLIGGNTTWYAVFIDEGDLSDIHNKYCADAVSIIRQKTGKLAVQLASFTKYDRALEFAQAVGGEVGHPQSPSSTQETLLTSQATVVKTGYDFQYTVTDAPVVREGDLVTIKYDKIVGNPQYPQFEEIQHWTIIFNLSTNRWHDTARQHLTSSPDPGPDPAPDPDNDSQGGDDSFTYSESNGVVTLRAVIQNNSPDPLLPNDHNFYVVTYPSN